MIQNKYLILGGSFSGVVVVGAVGLFLWHGQAQQNLRVSDADFNTSTGSEQGQSLSQPASVDSVPLGGSGPSADAASSGLKVAAGAAGSSLGQLGPDGANSSGQVTSTGGSSKPAASSPFDPSTFAQYDKYKDSKSALFAEVQAGNGAELTANKKAAVYYKGWLTNGQVFDQSRPDDKGKLQPFVFTLGAHQVIPGWEQAIAGMKVGGTRMMIIPPEVGYGSAGQPPIPPNSVLVFQVELVAVE